MTRYRPGQLGNVRGEEGLLLAVIARAVEDVAGRDTEQRAEARAYFANGAYSRHLGLLDLPGDWLPVPVAQAGRGGGNGG